MQAILSRPQLDLILTLNRSLSRGNEMEQAPNLTSLFQNMKYIVTVLPLQNKQKAKEPGELPNVSISPTLSQLKLEFLKGSEGNSLED